MKKRSIALYVVLSLITFGIYGLYWFYTTTNDVHEALGHDNSASGGMAILYCIITFGIYGFYWYYKMGEGISDALEKRSMKTSGSESLIYLAIAIFGLGIVSNCLIQDKLNDIIDYDNTHAIQD